MLDAANSMGADGYVLFAASLAGSISPTGAEIGDYSYLTDSAPYQA